MRRFGWVFLAAILGLAGCSSTPTPTSKSKAAEKFTAAFAAFTSGGQKILHQDQLPNTSGHPEYGPPSAAQDAAVANLLDQFRSQLISVDWPSPASDRVGAVESALSDDAADTRSIEGVSGASPAFGRDYANLTSAENRELKAEDQLRSSLGLPGR